jgi:hypothetical protein
MPIKVKLTCPLNGKASELLKTSPTLNQRIAAGREYAGRLVVDVRSLVIAEDVYGQKSEVARADLERWASAGAVPVLWDLAATDSVGVWRLPFLQWVKAISIETGEDIQIEYEHERGDTPYESAWWLSSPASAEVVEVFGVQSNAGRNTFEWRKTIRRYRDGRIETCAESSQWADLLAALHDVEDVERAVQAALTIADLADETHLADLEHLIQSADFFVRESVALPLAHLRGVAALPLLFDALTLGRQQGCDNDGLCTALSEVLLDHPAQAKPLLLQMLTDRSPDVRENATWALGYLSAEISPQPLLVALQDENPRVRASAAGSLGSFKSDEVIAALLPHLKDADEQVRVATAAALGMRIKQESG